MKQLPGFAAFLLKDHIDEVARVALRLSRELNIPVMKHFNISDEDLLKLMVPGYIELFKSFINDTTDQVIAKTVESWKNNQLPIIEREQIVAEDIPLAAQVRKQMLMHFLPLYTNDLPKALDIIQEIDDHQRKHTTELFRAYTNMLQSRIEKHMHELRQSDRLFRQAQAVTKIGNYVWDLHAKTITWSDELYRIYEIEVQSPIRNEMLRPYNHPDDNIIVDTSIGESITTGKPFNFYYRIVLKDGREKVLHARGEIEYDLAGNAVKIFGTAQDVTEQKGIEDRLEQNQKFIQKIADAAPAVITTYNFKTGQYLFVSEGLRKLLGYSPQEVIKEGVNFFMKSVHPDDLGPLLERNNREVQKTNSEFSEGMDEPVVEFQYRLRHANGEYRWLHTFGTVFGRDANGEVEHILNISLDITEKIKAEQILVERTKQLEQSNQSLTEFAFIASHDLKEPLRKISTLTDRLVMVENANLSENGKVYLQKVVSSSIRMQQMVDDLLSLAQVTGDRSYKNVSLKSLLGEVLLTFDQKIEETGAKIVSNGLPNAVVVPSQFRQLFQNLVSNSLKFRRPDVSTVVEITYEYLNAQAAAQYNLQPANRYLKISFADNGIGFDNKFLPKIFSIFQRLHPRHKYEGTGIGLSIVKKIVENHSGVIFANGLLNEGATFTVIIPDRA
jgi:PAS domain S-box-containing protein